jgi:hypothetical protein
MLPFSVATMELEKGLGDEVKILFLGKIGT